jgi:hypothetical protein
LFIANIILDSVLIDIKLVIVARLTRSIDIEEGIRDIIN